MEILVSGAERDISHLVTNASSIPVQPRNSLEIFLTKLWNRGLKTPTWQVTDTAGGVCGKISRACRWVKGQPVIQERITPGQSSLEHLGACWAKHSSQLTISLRSWRSSGICWSFLCPLVLGCHWLVSFLCSLVLGCHWLVGCQQPLGKVKDSCLTVARKIDLPVSMNLQANNSVVY